jgi:hypothetical protein
MRNLAGGFNLNDSGNTPIAILAASPAPTAETPAF